MVIIFVAELWVSVVLKYDLFHILTCEEAILLNRVLLLLLVRLFYKPATWNPSEWFGIRWKNEIKTIGKNPLERVFSKGFCEK